MSSKSRPANALIHETSPYLLQHAYNPVAWLPWGVEALSRAKQENKPIFLSIGYAACHWCHVMEHESFEDAEVAAQLNADFIPVKVDREERPDLDEIYMSATMVFTGGHGGWPMSVFLAPDLRPLYAGTYFPKENAYGRPGFRTVLAAIAKRWRETPEALLADSDQVVEVVQRLHTAGQPTDLITNDQIQVAADALCRAFDSSNGGIPSGSNRFPPSMAMDLLLRRFFVDRDPKKLAAVELTLEKMGNGGIYDHLGGGIHRYSTDPKWFVPHFEKMLYDQALVAPIFVEGLQVTESEELKRICADRARGICDYVLRDLTGPDGGFYSSEDADSEGLEGKFYLWTVEQIRELLDESAAAVFCSHYGASEFGNWSHPGDEHVPHGPKNILNVARSVETIARLTEMDQETIRASLEESRRTLFAARESRVRPGLDDKILCGWNGLMIGALAKVGAALDEPRYITGANRAADFLLTRLRVDGRLMATFGKGQARLNAYASDYAFVVEGLLALYEAAGEFNRVRQAAELTDVALAHYWDSASGGFYMTADDHEGLLVRSMTSQDGATPSANSTMARNLLRLALLLDRSDYADRAVAILRLFGDAAANQPFQSERMLTAAMEQAGGFVEIVILAESAGPDALVREVHSRYLPTKLIAQIDSVHLKEVEDLPLFRGRTLLEGKPTAYVCRNFTCREPVSRPEDLASQLSSIGPS
ncbi:MAG: thioredoxin domain-containing protein [Acidobacteria bacterium]|nr:thioredoxin domain-containing protein [Acidobacteriota bacterium]MDA1236022.1 thioredoxin domain-containing protein [Acidobacteriota bacterium]